MCRSSVRSTSCEAPGHCWRLREQLELQGTLARGWCARFGATSKARAGRALLLSSFAGGSASRGVCPVIILQATNVVKHCHGLWRRWDVPKSLSERDFTAVVLLWIPKQFYSVVSSTTLLVCCGDSTVTSLSLQKRRKTIHWCQRNKQLQ